MDQLNIQQFIRQVSLPNHARVWPVLPVLLAAELKDAARESARGAEYANNFNVCIDKTQNTYTIMPLEDFRNFPVTSQKTKNHA